MRFILFLIPFALTAKELPIVLKTGQVIVCPISNKPVYKMVKPLREGEPFTTDKMVEYGTDKHPEKGQRLECDAVVFGWGGACVYTNNGWVPEVCQKHLRATYTWVPIIE